MRSGDTVVLAMVYVAGMGVFAVAFFVDWIRSFEQIRRYWKHAIATSVIMVSLNFLMIAIAPGGWSALRIIGFMSLPLLFARIVSFTMLGTHYCARIGYPSFRLLPQEPAVETVSATEAPSPTAEDTNPEMNAFVPDESPALAEIPPQRISLVDVPMLQAGTPILQVDVPLPQDESPVPEIDIPVVQAGVPAEQAIAGNPPVVLSLRDYASDVLIVVAGSVVYSALLFLLAKPHIAEMIQRVFPMREDTVDAGRYSPFMLLLVLTFAFGEEITFRLGIQNFLAKYLNWQGNRYWAAIAATSLLWTIGHAGVLDPDWVKFAQIFPVGLMLGWLFRRHGVEACMLAHGLFNIIMIGLSSILLT